jgi:hypothetical protein
LNTGPGRLDVPTHWRQVKILTGNRHARLAVDACVVPAAVQRHLLQAVNDKKFPQGRQAG